MVADCIPVVLVGSVEDEDRARFVVAHAGRRGLLDGYCRPPWRACGSWAAAHITAWLGPSICGACYEVPEAMQAESTDDPACSPAR